MDQSMMSTASLNLMDSSAISTATGHSHSTNDADTVSPGLGLG